MYFRTNMYMHRKKNGKLYQNINWLHLVLVLKMILILIFCMFTSLYFINKGFFFLNGRIDLVNKYLLISCLCLGAISNEKEK